MGETKSKLEWHTDCGEIDPIDPLDDGEYEVDDWEPCVYCDDDDCVARIRIANA